MALFAQLDVNWPDNDKVIAVGLAGAGLHAVAMAIAKRTETDGVISRVLLARYGATPDLIDLLIDERLFDRVDDRRIAVHGWLDRNPSVSDYSAAARAGNHKRWRHPGPVDSCHRCNPDIAPESPPSRPGVGATEGDQTPDTSTETRPETPETVDNHTNGEMPRSVAIGRPPIAPDSPPDRPATPRRVAKRSPRIHKSETETDSETETSQQQRPARARPQTPPTPTVDNLDPDERAAREALAHITHIHRATKPGDPT